MNAGGSAGGGEIATTDRSSSSHRSSPSMYLQIQRLAGGGAGRRAEEGRMSKCEGCRLKEPFASPDVRHLLTSKQRRVIKVAGAPRGLAASLSCPNSARTARFARRRKKKKSLQQFQGDILGASLRPINLQDWIGSLPASVLAGPEAWSACRIKGGTSSRRAGTYS